MESRESALLIGASRGIGRTFALEAARRGVRPIAVARRFDPDDTDLLTAFTKASEIIARREAAEGLTPSLPQIDVGSQMKERLERLHGPRGRLW